ncbi:MAG: sigma-70 family RNA polymerase sigma factor [Bacteroidota bacterium]
MMTTRFEREALTQLPALRHYAESLTKDRQRSDDLVQETMLKALRYFDTYREGTNCRAWLFQICKHSFINEYRRKEYEPILVDFQSEAGGGDDAGEWHGVHPSLNDASAQQDDGAMLGDEVTSALRGLPHDYQTVLLLNDIEGYTYDEIAAFMQVPVGTIRSRIHRARKMLAARLERYAEELGYRQN